MINVCSMCKHIQKERKYGKIIIKNQFTESEKTVAICENCGNPCFVYEK